jgi:glycosyltransferase involved in cell wall biosynthesis
MKRPIRLAVLFDQQVHAGGGYQQALNAAMLVGRLSKDLVEPVYFTTLRENLETLANLGIEAKLLELSVISRAWVRLRTWLGSYLTLRIFKLFQQTNSFEFFFKENSIDLVYFLSPSHYADSLEETNYITTVWDLCHRDDPEFPEVRRDRQFEARESNYKAILPRAVAVLVDSDLGKQNIVKRYGIDDSRVYVMPFEASYASRTAAAGHIDEYVDVKTKFRLNAPYIIYPAQFWAHKNHVYLLEGLKELEVRYEVKIGVIFCGSDKGNKSYVEQYALNLGLSERVRFAGFVSDLEMGHLYKQSFALVMPTYFGPTNLPPLEAFELGLPVLYSDKDGLRDQVEGAGLLMDLKNPNSMAEHLFRLWSVPNLRAELIKAGHEKLAYLNKSDRSIILQKIIEDFYWRRLTWA